MRLSKSKIAARLEAEGFKSSPWHIARAESLLSRRFLAAGGTREQLASLKDSGLLPSSWHAKRADSLIDRKVTAALVKRGIPEGTAKKKVREIRGSGQVPVFSKIRVDRPAGLFEVRSMSEYRKLLADIAAGLAYSGEDVNEYEEWVSSIDY